MFDLQRALDAWRQELVQRGDLAQREIQEMAAHVEDQLDELVRSGLSPEEAWLVARRRLGGPDELAGEFAKLDRLRRLRAVAPWIAFGALALKGGLLLSARLNTVLGQWAYDGGSLSAAKLGVAGSGLVPLGVLLLLGWGFASCSPRRQALSIGALTAGLVGESFWELFVAFRNLSFEGRFLPDPFISVMNVGYWVDPIATVLLAVLGLAAVTLAHRRPGPPDAVSRRAT